MAPQTVPIRHALGVENLSNFMRLMTVHTRGENMFFFLPQLSPDDFKMNRFDLSVALCAGCGNIFACNGRTRIRVRQNSVGRMTCCAIRCDNESSFEKAFPVDAF
jgi:hypothetical protein